MTYDVDRLRARVPALNSGVSFFDGPGGTQTPDTVAAAIAGALTVGMSNRGRGTQAERNADDVTVAARQAAADLVNADPRGVVFGRSATSLTFEVARTLAQGWGPGDEIIVTRLDHDANVRPWVTAAERAGATVRWASFDRATGALDPEAVTSLINESTRLVAVTGASNILGTRPDIAAISTVVHDGDALLYVDGVHLTAHAPIDMRAMGADFFPREAAAKDEAEARGITEKQILAGLLLGVPLIVALLTLGPLSIRLLYADTFDAAIPLLAWMAWGVFVRLVAWPLGFWMMARRSPRAFIVVEGAACLISLALPLVLMDRMGLV